MIFSEMLPFPFTCKGPHALFHMDLGGCMALLANSWGSSLNRLGNCCLTELCCGDLALLLRSASSELRELELKDNDLKDSGVKLLCDGLEDANCKLQRLR